MHRARMKYGPAPASAGTVSVPVHWPDTRSSAPDAVATEAPADETSASGAVAEPNWPPTGHGVTEVTPSDDPAGTDPGANATDPNGTDGVNSTTRWLKLSATNTFPALSTATAMGWKRPLNGSVTGVPPAGSSTTRPLRLSATNTPPAASTATPPGWFSPLNGSVTGVPPAGSSTTRWLKLSATNTSPAP